MTAPASLRWLAARRLGATLVSLWCCAAAAQPVPAADTATRAAPAGAGAAGAASAAAVASATITPAAVAAAAAAPAPAPTPSCTADGGPAGRPPVGLVLSGGGARGYAHLGVLKVLEDNRIPIDCIAATSMGAVVGGLYASGMAADEMRKRLSEVNLTDIAFDVTDRADLPQSSREDERLYINSLTLGFGKKGVKAPVGLVQGNRLQALLADWTAAVPTNQPFDRLPIPYRAVATDLQTGQMIVLDRGSLPLAIRASMAMPGLFAPAEINGRALVDGGLVSNLPVDTARQMGAKVVIALDIGSQLRPLDALASPADVMQQMVGILIRQNVTSQRKQLAAQDVLLTPDLGSLAFTDFQNAKQAIAAGAAAATAALPRLRHLALTPEEYAAYRSAHAQPLPPPIRITRIEIKTTGGVPKRVVSDALHVKPGDIYDPATVSQDLLRLTTDGNFESVTQQIVSHGDDNVLEIDAREKYWGPNFLLFGVGMSSSSTDEGGFRLHVGYRRPWLTESGLEFRADATIGSDLQSARVELRQPLPAAYGFYISPYAEYQRRYVNVYDNTGEVKLNQYLMQTARAGLDFGLPIARLGDFRMGIGYATGHGSPNYNLPLPFEENGSTLMWPSFTSQALTARARLVIDQLDDPMFPRRGYYTELRIERSLWSHNSQSAEDLADTSNKPYTELYGKAMIAQQYGRHSVSATLEGGKSIGGTNLINAFNFTLGGFQHLAAYAADQLTGNELAYGNVTYMNQLMTFNASPIKALSVGASAELGNVWTSGVKVGGSTLKQSYTFFTSLTTAFGPLYMGVALAPGGRRNIYLQLGRTY